MTGDVVAEEFITDAVGSRLWARAWTPPGAQGNLNSFKVHAYEAGTRRLLTVKDTIPISTTRG